MNLRIKTGITRLTLTILILLLMVTQAYASVLVPISPDLAVDGTYYTYISSSSRSSDITSIWLSEEDTVFTGASFTGYWLSSHNMAGKIRVYYWTGSAWQLYTSVFPGNYTYTSFDIDFSGIYTTGIRFEAYYDSTSSYLDSTHMEVRGIKIHRSAKVSSETAINSIQNVTNNTLNNTWYNNQSSGYWANKASTNAESAANNAWSAANNTTYDGQSSAYWAYQASQNTAQAPNITNVKGAGGATCTTGTSFVAVVTSAPSTGVIYSASCIGPATPSISVSGNNITFSGCSTAGAYTATITATNGLKSSQATIVFFKI